MKLKTLALCMALTTPVMAENVIVDITGTVGEENIDSYFRLGEAVTLQYEIDMTAKHGLSGDVTYDEPPCMATYTLAILYSKLTTGSFGSNDTPSYTPSITMLNYPWAYSRLMHGDSLYGNTKINSYNIAYELDTTAGCELTDVDFSVFSPSDINLTVTYVNLDNTALLTLPIDITSIAFSGSDCPGCTSPVEDQLSDIEESVEATREALKIVSILMDSVSTQVEQIRNNPNVSVDEYLQKITDSLEAIKTRANASTTYSENIDRDVNFIREATQQ